MPDEYPHFADNYLLPKLKEVFQRLSGAGNFNRDLRQAIFLHVMETSGEGNFARTCRLLDFNLHTAKMWYNPTSPVYTPDFVEAKNAIKNRWKERKAS